MVCAEDVILWFKDAAAYKRIDVMCSLLNMCIPFELRYLGTCIEELGKHDYQELRGAAITANDIEKLAKEFNSSKGLLETTTRHRLTIYLSLLQSHNYRCANLLYSSIFRNEQLDVLLPTVLKDMNLHAELLLVYTMALNHPAFTFDQKTYFGDIVSRLNELTEIPQQTPNLSCPPCLGFYKPPLPVHHMPLVLKASSTHTEIPGVPGMSVPVNTVPNEFLSPPPPQMWPRPTHHYINTSCPPPPPPLPPPPVPEMPAFPPPVSPLVSQTSSPSQSRSVSPSRVYNVRQPQPPLQHIPPQIIDRIPPIISKDNVLSNPAFQTEYKTISSDELEFGEKIPWLDPINPSQTRHIKIPNGMLCNPQHCQQKPISADYLANELQQIQLDETLQCLSSSASSQSSDTQSPPDTPTDNQQPIIPPHGPGRGLKQSNGGAVPPPGLPLPQQQQEIYPNCSVPYTTQYPQAIAPFGNRSMTYFLRWVILLNFVLLLNSWKSDRRPKMFGESIPTSALYPRNNKKIQKKLVLYHNYFRSRVQPPAANMLKLKWHKGAADAAEQWAQECQLLIHDSVAGRYIDEYGSCGQNIFISTHKVPWYFAIKTWYLEKHNFTYGSDKNDLNIVGHYTQMTWASTHEIGCGFAKCHMLNKKHEKLPYYSYVCNYCPIGNKPGHIGHPYKKGHHCSACKGHCSGHKVKLCTNSCPVADLWANCEELNSQWPVWLCKAKRKKNCRATCECKGKIY